jgi:hypothetical protein
MGTVGRAIGLRGLVLPQLKNCLIGCPIKLSAAAVARPYVLVGHSYGAGRRAFCERLSRRRVQSAT